MKRLLITGGQGFMAINIASMFESDGWEVINPSHREMDLLNWDSFMGLMEMYHYQFDAIIHTAIKGGRRDKEDTYEDLKANLWMFENLIRFTQGNIPTVIYGSGAEYDRRYPINCEFEYEIWNRWPIDPYGLSKNLITRRALKEYNNIHILRLFGCFHFNENDTRFIKKSINNLKMGQPIEINRNKEMDFFSMDDVFTVTKYAIESKRQIHANLVYPEKLNLLNIADLIQKHSGTFAHPIVIHEIGNKLPYTGDGSYLRSLKIPLAGLESGIEKMVKILL